MTKTLAKTIPPLRSTENDEDPVIIAHYFNPMGRGDWWVIEGEEQEDGNWLFFGLADIIMREYGYFNLKKLEDIRLPFNMRIERDLYWTPIKVSELDN